MGVTPPYLYDPPSRRRQADPSYDFDPKAITRASWSTTVTEKPKQNGPLIDFNKHPDSYMIIPSGRGDNLPPFPSGTKKTIVVTRWIQFALRILQLIGALGLLVCVICLRGIANVESWIMRVPPAWDAVISTYAIFHLIRPAKARTPISSSSYHFFCLLMDIALIPFMVLTAFWSETNWSKATGSDGRWRSFFSADGTNTLLFVTWIVPIAVGTFHLISIGFDIYLVLVFRKIAHYPPDSNPLEDNLTSRVAGKHRYKNSELTIPVSEKNFATMSGSTLHLNRPNSQQVQGADDRPVPFYKSRTNLDSRYSGHNQETARMSRVNLLPNSSHVDITGRSSRGQSRSRGHSRSQSRSQSRPRSQGSANQSRNSYLSVDQHDPMPTRPHSFLSGDERPSCYSTPLPGPQASVPANVAKLQQEDGLLNDNWYVMPEDDQGDLSSPRRTPQPPTHEPEHDHDNDYSNPHHSALALSAGEEEEADLYPQPLKTTPPPPPPKHSGRPQTAMTDSTIDNGAFYFSDMPTNDTPVLDRYGNSHPASLRSFDNNIDASSIHNSEGTIGRALTISSAISAVSSLYSQGNTSIDDSSRAPSPKRKAYGDLASATKNIRGFSPPPVSASPALGYQNSLAPPRQPRGKSHSRERSRDGDEAREGLQRGHMERGGRVVSRTGVDLADASVMYTDASAQKARGRQVSGKVAEEGRAGQKNGWFMRRREVSGAAA